jgi:hypothetical protein
VVLRDQFQAVGAVAEAITEEIRQPVQMDRFVLHGLALQQRFLIL